MAALHTGTQVNDLPNASIFEAQTTANVAASPNSNIYVSYGGSSGVRVATSSDRGEHFAKSVRLSTANASSVAVAVSGDEDVFVSWNVGSNLYLARSANDGLSFSAPKLVTNSFYNGLTMTVEGNNVYLGDSSGYRIYTNTTDGVGAFVVTTRSPEAFGHLLADPSNGDVYQVTDNPTLIAGVSTNHAATFIDIPLSGGSIYYSNVASSFGELGKYAFVAGGAYDPSVADDAFRIDLETGDAVPLVVGEITNSQGRDLAADQLGNVVDSYYHDGEIRYRVSQDLGTTFGSEITVATAASSNVAINEAFQDVVVLYQVGGNLFVSTFANELLTQFDFGDAPLSYGTTLATNGARHATSSLFLGAAVDIDTDGQPSVAADGDNTHGVNDEDGVILPATFTSGQTTTITVNASAAGKLDGWIDLNRNGKFDVTEKIFNSVSVAAGNNELTLTVPFANVNGVIGESFARFRVSSAGGLTATGYAPDGEVEDYAVNLLGGGLVQVLPAGESHQNALTINGTGGSDAIAVQFVPGSTTQVRVVAFGKVQGPFALSSFDRIDIQGYAGNDAISIAREITKPATIRAGAGNDSVVSGSGDDLIFGEAGVDSLVGGAGTDVILGGGGNDTLVGGLGRDLLIGGNGVDSLNGQEGDDILIGGNTTHDENQQMLQTIAQAWAANASFDTRRTTLAANLNVNTVLNDGAKDKLSGNADRDWMLDFALLDLYLDFNANNTTGDRKN
ncbi:RTX-I toxin determinant A from serotypes 1/9 [Anatilimnocola aggregata]|uniref:RTX-I toxin determinant A from serotypes 1/9 n=2 Tax=Anatilimnocola aggregata TaxID=2528021 RepID=A0A517YCS0_9BACT|nr:RTX-I toxin determinant A from serotypes 1/9 [Anatilimnocola aggregata]